MGLGGSDSHSGDVGDLSVSISFHIMQNEDRTSPRWQRRDRSLQVEPDFGGLPPIDDLFQMPSEPTFPSSELSEYTDLNWPQDTYREFDTISTERSLKDHGA